MMKSFHKKYFILSILSVAIYNTIFVLFISQLYHILSHIDYVFVYVLPIGLVFNAIFIAPTLIVRNLSTSEKETFTKILAKISICFFIVSFLSASIAEYPVLLATYGIIIIFIFVFSVITIIYLVCVIIYADIKGMGEHINTIVSLMLKNLLISFYASLIIVSFFIFLGALVI